MSEEKQKSLKIADDSNLKGLEFEESIYKKLRLMLETSGVKNVTMISGFKDEMKISGKGNQKFEIDFLIVSAERKTVILLELKSSINEKSRHKVQEQLERGSNYLKQLFNDSRDQGWRYCKAIGTEILQRSNICTKCEPYMIDDNTNFETWWRSLFIFYNTGED